MSFGISVSKVTDHSQLITPMAPEKHGLAIYECVELKGLGASDLCPLAGPGCSLDLLSYIIHPSEYLLRQSTPVNFMEPALKS